MQEGGFSLTNISGMIGQSLNQESSKINQMAQTIDPSNEADLMQLQIEQSKWSTMVSLDSNLVSIIKDAMKSVVQNIR